MIDIDIKINMFVGPYML